jgi:uncharacterized protein
MALDGVILSNGVAITQRVIAALKAHGLRISISLDGVGAFHDAQRKFSNGRGSFAFVEKSLNRLAASGIQPSVTITISNRNLAGLPQVVEYALQRGLPFTLNFFRDNDCSASFDDLVYHETRLLEALRAAFEVVETHLPAHSLLGSLSDRARLDVPHDRPCGVGESYIVVNHLGGVARCHMELLSPVADLSSPDVLFALRNSHLGVQNPPVDRKPDCQACPWRYWCAGGCPALAYRTSGRYDARSPNCRIYQALFPQILRLEGLRLLRQNRPAG